MYRSKPSVKTKHFILKIKCFVVIDGSLHYTLCSLKTADLLAILPSVEMNSVIGFLLVEFVTLIGIYRKLEVCRACVVSQKEVWIWLGAVDITYSP
jgi:hypothetical protein